jgi:hypothetical protein
VQPFDALHRQIVPRFCSTEPLTNLEDSPDLYVRAKITLVSVGLIRLGCNRMGSRMAGLDEPKATAAVMA